MEHLPIYRSSTRRGRATLLQWRRTASWGAAAAALTLSGMALGYKGFSEASTEPPVAVAGVTVPAPMVALPPLLDGGHPDIISTLSSALMAHIQVAPPSVQQFLYGPLGPLLGPQPVVMTVEPVDFSVVLDEPMPVALDAAPVEAPVEEEAVAPTEDVVVEPTFTPVVAASRLLSFATVAIAPLDEGPAQVQSSVETPPDVPPPAPAPAAAVVAQAKPQTVAHAAAPPPVAQPQIAQPVREKPVPEVKHAAPAPVAEKEKKNGNGNGNGNDNKNNNDNGGKRGQGDSSKQDD